MYTVMATRGAEGCEVHGGIRGALRKEAEGQPMEMRILGEGGNASGMDFKAFQFSLEKIAGKDRRGRKMQSFGQCLHQLSKKSLTNLNQFP